MCCNSSCDGPIVDQCCLLPHLSDVLVGCRASERSYILTCGFCYSSNNKHVWTKRSLSIAPYPGMVITYVDTRPNHRYCMYRVSMAKLSRNNRLGLLVESHLAPLGSQRRRQVHVICSKMALRQVILLNVSYLATLRDRLYHHYSKPICVPHVI